MGLVVAAASGFVIWIVLWALGVKAFDAFLVLLVIVLAAIVVRVLLPALPGRKAS
jgi:hypothetical protein